jgi:hypothetical protein
MTSSKYMKNKLSQRAAGQICDLDQICKESTKFVGHKYKRDNAKIYMLDNNCVHRCLIM